MLSRIFKLSQSLRPLSWQSQMCSFATKKVFSKKEVEKHNQPNDCWMVIDQVVYDVSDYWKVHPGGGAWLLKFAGKDATIPFREYGHSSAAQAMLRGYGIEIGKLKEGESFDEKFFAPSKVKFEKKVKNDEEKKLLYPEKMSCQQCQQTSKNLGCSTIGVCGKNPTITFLQDNIIHYTKGLAQYLVKPEVQEFWDDELYHTFLESIFATLTNVNFDKTVHIQYLEKLAGLRDKYQKIYEEKAATKDERLTSPTSPSSFSFKKDLGYLILQGKQNGVEERKKTMDENLFALLELCMYGYKGLVAYFYHAEELRNFDKSIYTEEQRKELFKKIFEVYAGLTNPNPTLESLLGLNMAAGAANVTAMQFLDKAHTTLFGKPTPGQTPRTPVEGKCILVSGHDMLVLKRLLEQTEGTGINVYTHGEMLPAFSYPELRKHKHLVANFGQAWFAQNEDFANFPGAILLNSNCLIQPLKSYKHRIFTTHAVGWEGVPHITNSDFSSVIEAAKKEPGFKQDTEVFKKYSQPTENNGYGHETMTELLVPAIQAGAIKQIYVVGGCDNIDPERDFYRQFVLQLPKDAIVLTLGCGKYRVLGIRDEMGNLDGQFSHIPRLLDIGQCNDAYSAVKVALSLAGLFKCSVNELPLRLVLSWVEQKAVIILLSLLSLGVQNIIIGPNLPGFLTPTIVSYLVKNFKLSPTYANNLFSATQQLTIQKPKQIPVQSKAIKEFDRVRPFTLYQLKDKTKIARDTYKYTFAFNNPNSVYYLDAAKHILVRGKASDGYYQSRAYTPITPKGFKGSFEMLVRTYKNGLISNYLDQTKVGEYVEIQGPCGSHTYTRGKFIAENKTYYPTHINMIGGGVGNAVLYSLIQDILLNPKDKTKVSQIAAFSSADLVLLQKETEKLTANKQDQVKVQFNISKDHGRISKEKFEKFLYPAHSGKVLNIISGPDSFRNQAINFLKNLNFSEDNMVFYY